MTKILTSEEIKSIRKMKGLTQEEFARKVGYSTIYISKIETENCPVTSEFMENLKKAFDIELAYRKACKNYYEVQKRLWIEQKHFQRVIVCTALIILIFCLFV